MPKRAVEPFVPWESWDSPLKAALQKLGQSLGLKTPNDMSDIRHEYLINE